MEAHKIKALKSVFKEITKDLDEDDTDPFFCQVLLFDCDRVTSISLSMDERGEHLEDNHLHALRAAHAMMTQEIARLEAIEIQGTELLQ